MKARRTIADALADGDRDCVRRIAAAALKPLANNFVERPWGGVRIREYKGLCPLPDQTRVTGLGVGEAFELSACDADEEAAAHPSRLRFDDGSELTLGALLKAHGDALLGESLAARCGGDFPLLPKTLDVAELLSVQGHPEGNTEVYVIVDAEPGATLRVGFNRDIDPNELEASLRDGRVRQQRLLERLGAEDAAESVQQAVAPWLAAREAGLGELPDALRRRLDDAGRAAAGEAAAELERLKALYWDVLDSMNEIRVEPGMVVHNANPRRITAATGAPASAEVHALGNPEGREFLALEIRRPGPTFRAWDNVRFPLRRLDVDTAVAALNLRRVEPEELIVEPSAVDARPGAYRSAKGAGYALEHLRPAADAPTFVPRAGAHALHAIAGRVELYADDGRPIGAMRRGESALVPAGVGAYHVAAVESGAEVIKVDIEELP